MTQIQGRCEILVTARQDCMSQLMWSPDRRRRPDTKVLRDCNSTRMSLSIAQSARTPQHCSRVPRTCSALLTLSHLLHAIRTIFEDMQPTHTPTASRYNMRAATDAPLLFDTTWYSTAPTHHLTTTRHTASPLLPSGIRLLPYHQATLSHTAGSPTSPCYCCSSSCSS
jgi:hypothetical protein